MLILTYWIIQLVNNIINAMALIFTKLFTFQNKMKCAAAKEDESRETGLHRARFLKSAVQQISHPMLRHYLYTRYNEAQDSLGVPAPNLANCKKCLQPFEQKEAFNVEIVSVRKRKRFRKKLCEIKNCNIISYQCLQCDKETVLRGVDKTMTKDIPITPSSSHKLDDRKLNTPGPSAHTPPVAKEAATPSSDNTPAGRKKRKSMSKLQMMVSQEKKKKKVNVQKSFSLTDFLSL